MVVVDEVPERAERAAARPRRRHARPDVLRSAAECPLLVPAAVAGPEQHLGPVGGRIVAEVIVGLIQGDSQSYLRQDPDWTPTYGSGDTFEMTHLLTAAGVVSTLA